jgi:outer membrane protein OmpA-like peptidoglycan-associated protein
MSAMTQTLAKPPPAHRPPTADGPGRLLQRKCACGGSAEGKCASCTEEEKLQRRAIGPGGPAIAPAVVHEVLRSPGEALEPTARAFMERRLGHDFRRVRVHADPKAAESARAVGALAYTVGADVVFGAGQYAPATDAGRNLLAHELTHVVQQRGLAPAEGPLRIQVDADAREHEASAVSARAMGPAQGAPGIGADHSTGRRRLRRQPAPDLPTLTGMTGNPVADSLGASITLDGFASDSAALTDEHRARLADYTKQVAALLKQYPDSFMSIVGHTDATDTEKHNEKLGQDRADAVLAALAGGTPAVPTEIMRASSMGERSLKVPSQGREARNRRVEILFTARSFFKMPAPQPTPDLPRGQYGGLQTIPGIGPGPGPGPSTEFRPIPPFKEPKREWLKDALENDSIIRSLPKSIRDKAVDGLKDADEMLAEKIIDALPLDGKLKAVLQATVKGWLKKAKGHEFEVPVPQPPQYQQPPSSAPQMPAPSGVISSPPIRF